jgi:hypothetical protein
MQTNPQIPPYTFDQDSPRGFYLQTTPAGFMISHKRRRRAPAGPWPAGSAPPTGLVHPAITNRAFRSMLFNAWTKTLTSGQRAAWATIAPSYFFKNNKGKLVTLSAYPCYVHHNAAHVADWYTPPNPFTPDTSLIIDPTLIEYTPNENPYNVVVTTCSAGSFTVSWLPDTGPPRLSFATFQISNPHKPTTTSYGSQFSAVPGCVVTSPSPPTEMATCNYQSIIEIPPRPGLRTIRLCPIPPRSNDFFVSYWTAFQLDLSVYF